jgi:hypothetical protein
MENPSERINFLEKELEEMRFTAIVFKESEEKRALELKHEKESRETRENNLKNQLEREKQFLNNKLERETTRLKNIISDKEQEIEEIKTTWQKVYNLEKQHKENAQAEIKRLQNERANKVEREATLEAKVQNLKLDKSTLSNKITELEETIKGLQPSYAYTIAEKLGFIKLKGWLVNTAVVFALIVILYLASIFLKYIARPAWLNFAAFFPKRKKQKVITVEEEEAEEEEILKIQSKPKPKKPKVLRSNTKTKPKSKTK